MRLGAPRPILCLTTEGVVVWKFAVELDAAVRAALQGNQSLVYQCAPAWWPTVPLFDALSPPSAPVHSVLLVPDVATADEGATVLRDVAGLRPVFAARGNARSIRRLQGGAVGTLILPPLTLLHLVSQSSVELAAVTRVVLLWPEQHLACGFSAALDTILAEASAAQRIIVTSDTTPLTSFLERHARRAPLQRATGDPDQPVGAARYATTTWSRVPADIRAALDALDPASAFVWDPVPGRDLATPLDDPSVEIGAAVDSAEVELAIAAELPSVEALAALRSRARDVLVLLRAPQFSYLQRLVERPRSLKLPSEADHAIDRTTKVHEAVRRRIRDAVPDPELVALAPLFDEFDPALVAAAIAQGALSDRTPTAPGDLPAWVRIRVSGGARDRIRTGDLVGALLNAVGLSKKQVGRVEILDAFSLIEVQADAAERARAGLHGLVVRGRTLSAGFDRR